MAISRDKYQQIMDDINQRSLEIFLQQNLTIADRLEQLSTECGDKPLLIWKNREISYAQIDRAAEKYAKIALRHGVGAGDCAALMMENRPEFLAAWFGLLKIGAIAALIHPEARGRALEYALTLVDNRLLFLGAECSEHYLYAEGEHRKIPTILIPDTDTNADTDLEAADEYIPWTQALQDAEDTEFSADCRQKIGCMDVACFLYTSGTTGHPKAVRISHGKWLSTGHRWIGMAGVNERDIFYCVLPLYHGAALMSLFSTVLAVGGTMVLRRKFSVRNFWKDIALHRVSTVQYIGEICRYLINTPPVPEERAHSLRRMFGAGMGVEVSRKFATRFGEDIQIYEGWGSTESNAGMTNLDNTPGSCGRIPYLERSPMRIVRYDVEQDIHPRDDNGFIQLAAVDEPGEIIAQVHTAQGQPVAPFDGYSDAADNEKKLLRDAFAKGDCWFRSGDILRCDAEGHCYFVDRVGDTFRWKSENVSTTEVEQQLSKYEDMEIINVYGVKVPGHEGRCGMAALQLKPGADFDAGKFYQLVCELLPHYAQPQFVRICQGEMDMTGTYKLRKKTLQSEGYDPERYSDHLYLINPIAGCYELYSEKGLQLLGLPPDTGQS